jgi:DNA-binding GntR family transcriptional regulator
MRKVKNAIPKKLLKEIFPKKAKSILVSDLVYSHVKDLISSGKLKKGQRLIREKIAQDLGVSVYAVAMTFLLLKKEGKIVVKHGEGSFVV